jgi:hypothetical protein
VSLLKLLSPFPTVRRAWIVGRVGRNARGSLARSVHGQLGSARIGSFEFFYELS